MEYMADFNKDGGCGNKEEDTSEICGDTVGRT